MTVIWNIAGDFFHVDVINLKNKDRKLLQADKYTNRSLEFDILKEDKYLQRINVPVIFARILAWIQPALLQHCCLDCCSTLFQYLLDIYF